MSSFGLMTSLNHIRKNGNLERQWQYKKQNALTENKTELQRKNEGYKESIFEMLERQNGDDTLQRIMSKYQAGGKLSANEMLYLQKYHPTIYQEVRNAEMEAKQYEESLRRCETQDEVRRLKMNKINASIAKIKSAERAGVPEGARLGIAQAELRKIQEIERITLAFIKSGDFAKLPTDAEKFEAEQEIKEAQREALKGENRDQVTEIRNQETEIEEAGNRKQEAEGVKPDETEKILGDGSSEIKTEVKSELVDSKRPVEEIENSQEYKKIKGNKVKKAYVKAVLDYNITDEK